jgi:hypothetical protein
MYFRCKNEKTFLVYKVLFDKILKYSVNKLKLPVNDEKAQRYKGLTAQRLMAFCKYFFITCFAFVPLCLCAFVPLRLCTFAPLRLCAFVPLRQYI